MKFRAIPQGIGERIALALNLAPLPLVDTQIAFSAARAIMAAADTGIFETIGKSRKTVEQISSEAGTNPVATKHLLDCLVGIGYLDWGNDQYTLKKKFYKWLLQEYPSNVIGKLRFQLSEWDWMAKLEDFVRSGDPMDMHQYLTPAEWANYQEGMRDLSINTAKELGGKLKLGPNAVRMLDIGGSHGLYSIELCKNNPSLSSTILELPGAIDRASEIAGRYGLQDRVKYRAGNALKEDLGENEYDLVMINNVVHHFTEDENRDLANKIARALKPGGTYAIGEFIRAARPGEGGAIASTSGLYFALTSSSGTWSEQDIRSWQQGADLRHRKTIGLMTLPGWKMVAAVK